MAKASAAKAKAKEPDIPPWHELEAKRVKFAAEADRREREGGAKPVIYGRLNGTTFVAVGGALRYSERWRTFADFLVDYVVGEVGTDWFKAEWEKPAADRHPLTKLRAAFYEFAAAQTYERGISDASPSGPAYEYLLVAYELYLVAHHMKLQKLVIDRLKNPDNYEGARYELLVAAAFIRAGLLIEMEDESDVSARHPEFIAKHPPTGFRFAVEAKRRQRDVKSERTAARPDKADVSGLLTSAFKKKPALPYLVFVDVNLPPAEAADGADPEHVVKQVEATLKRLPKDSDGKDPYSVLALTNRPDLYVGVLNVAPSYWVYFLAAENPRYGGIPADAVEALRRVLQRQRELPADVFDPILR